MAAHAQVHPAIAVGLAGGIGMILPAAAFVATIPFDGVHEAVGAGGMPFAIGAVAGAGMCAAATAALAASAERAEAVSTAAEAHPSARAAGLVRDGGASRTGQTGIFRRRPADADIPVISRAEDALPEDKAWAEIDSIFDGSPISCESTSKDIYQIALEELARKGAEGGQGTAAASAGAPGWGEAPAAVTRAIPAVPPFPVGDTASVPEPVSRPATVLDTDEARRAAFASLDVPVAGLDGTGALVEPAGRDAEPAAATGRIPMRAAMAVKPPVPARYPVAAPAAPAPYPVEAPVMPAPTSAVASVPEVVPEADYSGHEDMWAAALAILGEDEAVSTPSAPAATPTASIGRHAAASPARAAAVAEGARRTAEHGRVNEILDEELARIPSRSMRRTGHEYLRVIQGGTMSFPPLTAEA